MQMPLCVSGADAANVRSISIAFILICTSAELMEDAKNVQLTLTVSSRTHHSQTKIRYSVTHVSLNMFARPALIHQNCAANQTVTAQMSNLHRNAIQT